MCDQYIASGSCDKTVKVWNMETGILLHNFTGHSNKVRTISFSGIGDYLASGAEDKTVRIWNINSGMCVHILKGHTKSVINVVF